jgi:cytochrome c peroxidase
VTWLLRQRLVLLTICAGCWAGASVFAADPLPESPSRNTVWRSIFARPEPLKGLPNARTELGRDLFRDGRLSGDGGMSCATCHDPGRAFTDGRQTGAARGGGALLRNVPALFNLAWSKSFFWDGRAISLEEQAKVPILAADEMAGKFEVIAKRLKADPEMRSRFAAAFPPGGEIREAEILAALAAYERSLVSAPTRFDRWVEGDDAALSREEADGFSIFVGKGGCVGCHGGWRFTDDAFHDIGLKSTDPGRGAVPGGIPGLRAFKTPSLREAPKTAPYMHDGSLATLMAVVEHYAGGIEKRPSLAANVVRDLVLTEYEKRALVAFLRTLSSD